MSKENVKKFYEALNANQALAEDLQNAVNAVVQQFAAKQNLAFTAEELAEYATEVRKLSDEELDQVNAGGRSGTSFSGANVQLTVSPFDSCH